MIVLFIYLAIAFGVAFMYLAFEEGQPIDYVIAAGLGLAWPLIAFIAVVSYLFLAVALTFRD